MEVGRRERRSLWGRPSSSARLGVAWACYLTHRPSRWSVSSPRTSSQDSPRPLIDVKRSAQPAHVVLPGMSYRRLGQVLDPLHLLESVADLPLCSHLDESVFRFNHRCSKSRGLLFCR